MRIKKIKKIDLKDFLCSDGAKSPRLSAEERPGFLCTSSSSNVGVGRSGGGPGSRFHDDTASFPRAAAVVAGAASHGEDPLTIEIEPFGMTRSAETS
eukprot:9034902-Karenia_brevis.AAC.1